MQSRKAPPTTIESTAKLFLEVGYSTRCRQEKGQDVEVLPSQPNADYGGPKSAFSYTLDSPHIAFSPNPGKSVAFRTYIRTASIGVAARPSPQNSSL
jgi:hypothetical protein